MRNETEKKDKISREKKERGAGHREAFPVTAPLFSVKKWEHKINYKKSFRVHKKLQKLQEKN